ncbi:MAG: hypothetical protein VX815_11065, partial [Gemmatimonadota bacterium]|nr:hypothetical protein [Gemmatimonadota bacterium]
LLPLVAPVLLSMLVPATVAGWGVREATAAALLGRRRTHSGGRSGDLGRLAGFDGLQEWEAMKVRVAGADTADTMLSHENRGLSVVHEISRQHRHLTDHLIEFGAFVIGLAFRGDKMAGCDDST